MVNGPHEIPGNITSEGTEFEILSSFNPHLRTSTSHSSSTLDTFHSFPPTSRSGTSDSLYAIATSTPTTNYGTSLPMDFSSLTGGMPPLGANGDSEGEGARFPDIDVGHGGRENENYRSNFNPIVPILPRPASANLPVRQKSTGEVASTPEREVFDKSITEKKVFGTSPRGTIGIHKPRAIVRVERDYSAGELCQFWSGWKEELQGRVTPTTYQTTMNDLNTILASANDPYKSIFDNCLSILTLYLSPFLLGSHYEREMRKFDSVLEKANQTIYNPAGLNFLPPRKCAYLFLEIEYY